MSEDWMPGVRKVVTAATSSRTLPPEGIVFHVIEGSRSTMDEWARQRFLTKAQQRLCGRSTGQESTLMTIRSGSPQKASQRQPGTMLSMQLL